MTMTYIKVFLDSLNMIEPLNNEERGRLFTALLQYAQTQETPALEGNERFLFPTFRAQLDREAANYQTLCQTNRANGSLGGRPRKKPDGFSETQKSQDKEKDKDKEEDKEKDKEKEKDKDYLFSGAGRPRQRKNNSNRYFSSTPTDYAQAREDIARMKKYLQDLRNQQEPPDGS